MEKFVQYFIKERLNFLLPPEIFNEFENVIKPSKVEEKKADENVKKVIVHEAYPLIVRELRDIDNFSDEDLYNKVNESIHQIYMPDRELNTSLTKIFQNQRFNVFNQIKTQLETSSDKNVYHKEAEEQFKYIYEYHFKFDKTYLNYFYSEFHYLIDEFDFCELDKETRDSITFFRRNLKQISEKMIAMFKL